MTKGPWDFACDSYGKVQHSRKACVYATQRDPKGGDRLVRVASRIENWSDAKLNSCRSETGCRTTTPSCLTRPEPGRVRRGNTARNR